MAETIKIPGVGPVKRSWVYAGIGITVGILALAYWRRAQAAGDELTPAEGAMAGGYLGEAYAAGGYTDLAGGGSAEPAQWPYGTDLFGNLLPPPTGVPGAAGPYATNLAWSDAAVAALERGGVTEAAAAEAVSRVLGGLRVTSAQEGMYLQAVGLLGPPPQGAPAIQVVDTPADPKPAAPPSGTTLPAPGGIWPTGASTSTASIAWRPVTGATGYAVYVARGDKPGKKELVVKTTSVTLKGLYPGIRYRFDVHPVGQDGRNGGRARIYMTTHRR